MPAIVAERSFEPRPVIDGRKLAGARCVACGHPSAIVAPRCTRCGAELAPAVFGPAGVVWAATTIHVASGGRAAPYTLAYVDLDDGPRLLAHVAGGRTVEVADRVRLVGTAGGDPRVEVIR